MNLFQAKRSIINIFSTHSISIISALSAIILTPYILHRIGNIQYAVWIILNALIGYFNFSKLGLTTKMLRDLSKAKGAKPNKIINSTLFCILFIQLAISPLLIFAYIWLKIFVKPETGYIFQVLITFYILYAAFFLSLIGRIFSTIFHSQNKHYFVNGLIIVRILIHFLLVIILGSIHKLNIITLSFVTLFLSFLSTWILFVQSRRILPFKIDKTHFDKGYIKVSLVPSLQYFILSISALIIFQSDVLVISSFLGAGAVTSYALGYRIVEIPQRLLWAVSDVLFPKIAHFYSHEHWKDLLLIFKKIFYVVIPCNVILSILLYFFGQKILTLWVGNEYVLNKNILDIFIITFCIQTIAHTYGIIINAIGKQKAIAYMVIFEAVLNLSLSIILVQRIGLIGVALGTLIAHLCATGWFACFYVHKILNPIFRTLSKP